MGKQAQKSESKEEWSIKCESYDNSTLEKGTATSVKYDVKGFTSDIRLVWFSMKDENGERKAVWHILDINKKFANEKLIASDGTVHKDWIEKAMGAIEKGANSLEIEKILATGNDEGKTKAESILNRIREYGAKIFAPTKEEKKEPVKKEEEKAKPKEEPKKAEAKTEEEAEPAEESKKEEKKTETAIGTKEMDEISKKIAAAKGAIAESKPKEVTGGSSGKAAEINSAPETEKGKEKKKEKNGKTKPAAKAEIDAEEAKAKSDSSLTNAFDKKKEEKPKSTSLIIYSDNALEENDEKKIATVYVRIPFKKWMKNVGVKEDYLDIKINVTKEELQNNFKNIVTEIQKKAYTRALAIKDKGGGGLKATYKQNMDDSDYSNQQYVLKPHIDGAVQEELSKEKTKLNK